MDIVWSAVLLIAVATSSFCRASYSYTVQVDSLHGNDSSCKKNAASVPCQTLHQAFQLPHKCSTQYILSEGTHYLSENVTFENLEMIAFVGSNSTINCRVSDVGFAFTDMTRLSFANLTITGCSALRNSTSRNFNYTENFILQKFYVGLYLYHCRDVEMSGVTVRDSPNAIGVVMYDTDGTVTIASSTFTNNSVLADNSERPYPGGGGFYVEFSYCIPGDLSCKHDKYISYESQNSLAQYSFIGSTFSSNVANNFDSNIGSYTVPYRTNYESFGRGGGLAVFFKGNATGNSFNISGCVFDSNQAVWGGGLIIEFEDDTKDNMVVVSHSIITNNSCYFKIDSGTASGGMRITHLIYFSNPYSTEGGNNTVIVDGCTFQNNVAWNGGGLTIMASAQSSTQDLVSSFSIKNTEFRRNVARLGSAIEINRFSLTPTGLLPRVLLEDCTFTENNVDYVDYVDGYSNEPYQIGKGAVFIHQIDVSFKKEVSFDHNAGTALVLVGTAVNFTGCTASFYHNTGNNGGAIALLGAAHILINDDTYMHFINNTAFSEGGAIYNRYIEDQNLKAYTNCFIRHEKFWLHPDEWKSQFHFWLNTDRNGKRISSIYSTSVLPCLWAGGSGITDNQNKVFCWKHWVYYEHLFKTRVNCNVEVSTDIGKIAFTTENNTAVKVIPGQPVTLPIIIHDDFSTDVHNQTVFRASISSSNHSENARASLTDSLAYVWGETITMRGEENTSITLQLDSLGDREWRLEVAIELQMCPPGFKTTNKGNETVCECAGRYKGAVVCDPVSFLALLKNDNWMGTIPEMMKEDNHYVVSSCPPGYCYTNTTSSYVFLPNNTESLNDLICGTQHRKGVLCGECVDGFGPAVNTLTYECINCSDENIATNVVKYVASIYIPLGLMFTILILFDIRLTTGPANAFILYCQVVASTFDLYADGQIPLNLITNSPKISDILVKVYRLPYGIFNLEFVENFLPPLCLGTHFNNLSVFLLDYAVAISPLLMIIMVILFVKLTSCIRRCVCNKGRRKRINNLFYTRDDTKRRRSINEAILPAFAAFFLLSYTKFSVVSSYLVASHWPLRKEDGSPVEPGRVYFAGHFTNEDHTYLTFYFRPAIVMFATFVSIPPLLLLDYPLRVFEWCISKVDRMWKRYPVDKVHVLLDTFQGCYKNKMRFFAGLYFLFRLAINLFYILADTWLEQFVAQQIACIIMIVLLALCQPYESQFLNFVDILIFSNLALLNALSFYLYSFTKSNPELPPPTSAFVIQYLFVFLPLFYMLGYIMWRVTKPCHHKIIHHFLRLVSAVRNRHSEHHLKLVAADIRSHTSLNDPQQDGATDTDDDDLFERAEEDNRYRPIRSQSSENNMLSKRSTNSEDSGLHTAGNTPRVTTCSNIGDTPRNTGCSDIV